MPLPLLLSLVWQRLQWITSGAADVGRRILVFGIGNGDDVRMRETSGLEVRGSPLDIPVPGSRMIWPPLLPLEDVDSRLKRF